MSSPIAVNKRKQGSPKRHPHFPRFEGAQTILLVGQFSTLTDCINGVAGIEGQGMVAQEVSGVECRREETFGGSPDNSNAAETFGVLDPWFIVFAVIYISSLSQHLYEVLSSGGSIKTWWNEQRFWMIRTVTACLFGCLDLVLKQIGVAKANFRLTNKAIDQNKLEKYEKGKFDFEGAKMFMVPLTFMVLLNMVCFAGGVKRMITVGNCGEMFGQFFLCSVILVLSYPILEGLVSRKGK